MSRLLIACMVTALAGCGALDFDVSQNVPAQTVQGSGLPAPLASVFPIPLNLDINSKIKQQNTGPIDSVTLSSLHLEITSTGGDWSFVSSIDVFVESTKAGTTLPKVKIASVSKPGAVRAFDFQVNGDVNLKPYIDEGSQVDSNGAGTQPTQDITFDGKATFTVHPL
ncbi:MAG TPA: hypothetical protein VFP84_12030 [Kofleriaceae bacterium]|nr:hypothetical protein [Kofleriaceae bacterium]